MLAAAIEKECQEATGDLQTLGTLSYKASAKKAQIAKQEVTYLSYKIKQGQRWLTQAMKKTILQIPEPANPRQVRKISGNGGILLVMDLGVCRKGQAPI